MEITGVGKAATAVAVSVLLLAGAAAGAKTEAAVPPCFHACFDQCVQREEYWFCQFSCYRRCGAGARAGAGLFSGDCEHACALSMCGQIDPDSKMMAVCRNTCGKSYSVAGCRRRPTNRPSLTAAV
uniref:Knottin scorpion toxin-like domain-containing protein n=1 Tax=Leersia perrieri TaxID=77586 RepID=A0A0D9V2J2_9ORYZ